MASVDATLSISVGDADNLSIRGHLKTHNDGIKIQLERLGYQFETYGSKDNEYFLCKVAAKEGSSELNRVRSVLIDAGIRESARTVIPKKDREGQFAFKYIRNFNRNDLDQAEYLRLNVMGHQRIADWRETAAEGYVLKANKRLENNLDFGWLDIIIVPYVSENGRKRMEKEGFLGVRFEPAVFDEPKRASKQLFELTSVLTMPPCLLPIQNDDGDLVAEDWKLGARIWDDAGYVQPILKYRRKEVEAMGAFDIAKTRETTGNLPQHYRHQYIVSQRFRQHLEAMKVRSVDFVPVELVDVAT